MSLTETIRVFIVDDHAVVREGLRALISTEAGIEVVGEAADGREAVARIPSLQPDVILLDLVMPLKSGIEVISEITRDNPEARILVLTSFAEDDKVFPAIKAGAMGYILKDSSSEQLEKAIYSVYSGEISLHPRIAIKVIKELQNPSGTLPLTQLPLTEREVIVLKLVAQGLTNQEISDRLFLSRQTVDTHVRNILGKLHVANRTQAALYALRKGLAELEE